MEEAQSFNIFRSLLIGNELYEYDTSSNRGYILQMCIDFSLKPLK